MQLAPSITIIQVTISVAIMQILKFYSNYAGSTLCRSYAGGSFCCNHTGDCFYCNFAVKVSAALMHVTVSTANMWVTIYIVIKDVDFKICQNLRLHMKIIC